jgi:hypothetical protein
MHSSLPDKKMTSSRFVPDMNEKNNEVAVSPSTKKSAKFCLTMSVWVFFKLFPLRMLRHYNFEKVDYKRITH